MPVLEWILIVALVTMYLFCLFTVCSITFKKGYTLLGVLGIFMPFAWLIGAILPPKPGSQLDMARQQGQTGTL